MKFQYLKLKIIYYTNLVGSLNIVPDISPHVYQIKVHILNRKNYFMNRIESYYEL